MNGDGALDEALAHYAAGRSQQALDGLLAIPNIGRTPAGCTLVASLMVDLGRAAEALPYVAAGLRLAPGEPALLSAAGRVYQALGRWSDALAVFDRALAVGATADRHRDRGWALHKGGRFADAIADFDAALQLDPGDADAETCRGMARLISGDYALGLRDYEARYRRRHFPVRMPDLFDCPTWRGEDLAGKRILVHAEQGLGDAIQFARMASLLAARGADVVLGAPARLVRLLTPLVGPHVAVRDVSLPDEHFDFTVPLMSLPQRLGVTLDTVPWSGPYLAAEPERVDAWRQRLGDDGRRLIGVVWQGNPAGSVDVGRSMPLASLAPLAKLKTVRLVALQKTHGLDQLADLPAGMRVETLGDTFDDGPDAFADTAAVMALCDTIVTSDTAPAHLAGALGRPGIVLLQHVPDWRWGASGTTTPWYPTLRLARQPRPDDWGAAVARAVKLFKAG